MTRKSGIIVLCAVVLGWASPGAWALINPNFTPIHLTGEAQVILKVKADAKPAGGRMTLTVVDALKGKGEGKIVLDLSATVKEHAEFVREQLASAAGKDMLLFAGEYPGADDRVTPRGCLHVNGKWLLLAPRKGGGWSTVIGDEWMAGTWNGGTDMLERCVRYILKHEGDATVPVVSGTGWRAITKIATIKGKVRRVRAVDLAGDGKLVLHLASSEGDLLLRAKGDDEAEFENLTAARKLKAKSLADAWGDFNGDGRLDLAGWDGKTLTIHSQQADGTFSAAKAKGTFAIPAKGASLAVIGRGGKSGLVVGGVTPPVLLTPAAGGAFRAVKLSNGKVDAAKFGKPQAPVVADFNNDGLADILVPGEKGGMLYAAKADGSFAPGTPCGVHCTEGGGVADVGDFDADGWLDVLAAGVEGVRVWQNLRNGTFAERMQLSGEISYKAQPFASFVGVCDFNNDSRQDVFITYADQQPLLYFNRGFRSYGQAPKLEGELSTGPDDAGGIEGVDAGQQTGTFADVDADGAQDFIIAMPDGAVWCAYNDLGDDCLAVRVRLAGEVAGPVSATFWQEKRCLGTVVARRAKPAFMGIEEAGEFTVKFRLPGGKQQARTFTVEEGVVDVMVGKAK